ncbi:MAG: response regulator [Clostridiales bacterium]
MINVNLKNSKILIVDDVIKNIEFLVNVLSNEGYSIGYSLNGFDAINTIKSTNYDIVLLDIMLPDINGYDICTHIRKNLHMSIPILFVTAKGDIDSVLKGFDVGGNDYISKPVNIQELLFRVKTHLLVKKQADLLKKQTELLKNSNINLEVKVREKTTELHEALNQLEDNNVKLKSLNKAKTDFLTLISHELNTPLSAIYGFSELLERLISNEKQLKMVKQIKKSSKRLIRISKMSILITSINSHIYKYNFINETVENLILDSIEIEKKNIKSKKINISYIFENKKLKVNVDKEIIIDLMSSLLNNSV